MPDSSEKVTPKPLLVGFGMGNPWVGKFQPVPILTYTIPVSPQCHMKPTVFLVPVGSYTFNLFATSQDQLTHVNGQGGAFHKVLGEGEVMRLV